MTVDGVNDDTQRVRDIRWFERQLRGLGIEAQRSSDRGAFLSDISCGVLEPHM